MGFIYIFTPFAMTSAHDPIVLCLAAQSCFRILYNPMNCSPPGSSVHGNSPGKNTEVGCHFLLQGIFPTQVSHIAGWFSTIWTTREAQPHYFVPKLLPKIPGFCINSSFLHLYLWSIPKKSRIGSEILQKLKMKHRPENEWNWVCWTSRLVARFQTSIHSNRRTPRPHQPHLLHDHW